MSARIHCACRLSYSREEFDALPLPNSGRDRMDVPAATTDCDCGAGPGAADARQCEGHPFVLVMRNCSCGSTICRKERLGRLEDAITILNLEEIRRGQ